MSGNGDATEAVSADQLEIVKVAFAEAVRKLEAGHGAAESVRSRAGTVIAASTAVGGFVGGLAIDRSPHGWEWALAVLGFAAYVASLAFSLSALLPKKGVWASGQNTRTLAEVAVNSSDTAFAVYGHLAAEYQKGFEANENLVKRMATKVRSAVGLMVAELLLFVWLLAMATGAGPAVTEGPTAGTTTSTTTATSTTTSQTSATLTTRPSASSTTVP